MNKRSSSSTRIAAVTALVLAVVVILVVIGSAGGGGSSPGKHGHGHTTSHGAGKPKHQIPASYEIQSGDTLISIAHETGVPVREIEALNPAVDPQILIAGETLKLR